MKTRGQRGALLVHSMVAAVILSLCLAVFIQTLVLGLRSMKDVEDSTTAMLLLENKMIALIQRGYIADSSKEEGVFQKPYEKFKYSLAAFPVQDKRGENRINEVVLSVSWLSGRNLKEVSLSSYLFAKNER